MNPMAIIATMGGLQELILKAIELYDSYKKSIDDSISIGDLKLEDLQETIQKMKDQGKLNPGFSIDAFNTTHIN